MKLTYFGTIYSKKNSKRIVRTKNRQFLISSARAIEMERDMVEQFHTQLRTQLSTKAGSFDWREETHRILDGLVPVGVNLKIYNKDKRPRDLDNQATSILDGLVKANVLVDDKSDIVRVLRVEYKGIDKENPRAEIEILPLDESAEP